MLYVKKIFHFFIFGWIVKNSPAICILKKLKKNKLFLFYNFTTTQFATFKIAIFDTDNVVLGIYETTSSKYILDKVQVKKSQPNNNLPVCLSN